MNDLMISNVILTVTIIISNLLLLRIYLADESRRSSFPVAACLAAIMLCMASLMITIL